MPVNGFLYMKKEDGVIKLYIEDNDMSKYSMFYFINKKAKRDYNEDRSFIV